MQEKWSAIYSFFLQKDLTLRLILTRSGGKAGGYKPQHFSLPRYILDLLSSGSHMSQPFSGTSFKNVIKLSEDSDVEAWKTERLWHMATGEQKKANKWHGRENVVAYGRLPSPALLTCVL